MCDKYLLLGCGILKREVTFLAEKNGWPMEFLYLDSALHAEFGALARGLNTCLASHSDRNPIVFYGACHPRMEYFLEHAGVSRIAGQNCVEMLIGAPRFEKELEKGAFFLLEEWARRWRRILSATFGPNEDVMRDIFQHDRKYLLALKTPCSPDFSAEAQRAAEMVGLPLRWADVNLDHLEAVLSAALEARSRETPCLT